MAKLTELGERGKIGPSIKKSNGMKKESNRDEAVISTGKFWFLLFLMYIPIIGWVTTLMFSFEKNRNINIRNLSRATLINKVILLIIVIILGFGLYTIYAYIQTQLNYLYELISAIPDNPENIVTILKRIKELLAFFQ